MRPVRGYYDVFMRTCAKFSSSIAMRYYEQGVYTNYTYSELYGVCEYITQILQQLNCNKGIIGLVSERNIIIPCMIAAAHKCCTTFMFIDPSQDIESVTSDVSLDIIVAIRKQDSTSKLLEMLGKEPDKTVTVFNLNIDFFCCSSNKSEMRITNQHSFIARTSGSTGEPKHIQVPVQCIQPNINDLTKMFKIVPEDVIYFSTPLTFDPSMVEILLACMNGASLLIAPDKADVLFPESRRNSITFWQTTPSKFFQYSNADIKNKILSANSTLKVLALGGEPLNGLKRLKELKDPDNKTRIFGLYGVTEMSCWACAAEIDLDKANIDREVPLGNCLSETEMIIEPTMNKSNIGKILLVSKTRTCYILSQQKEQNSLKFVDTGDIGEIKNGTVYYRGRTDDVIKRFGTKVSLHLIESTIKQCPQVKTCSCVWLPKPLLLIVYFSSETLNSQELLDFLKCKLDDKHWPDKVVRVDNLPTSFHGKISKQLLSKMYEKLVTTPQNSETLKNNLLKELKAATSSNITFDKIKDKDFFSIGGTSFLAVSICNKLSITCPEFGKLIQPYLLSTRYTIGDILDIALKEMCLEETKSKRRVKRSRSVQSSAIELSPSHKKSSLVTCGSSVGFIVVWTIDTGKCVDASPTLFQAGVNLFVTVGSHSGKIVVMDAIGGILHGTVTIKSRVEAGVLCYQEAGAAACGVVGAHDGTIVCFKLSGCKELWRTNIGVMIKSKAVYCKGLIYVAAYDGFIRCLDAVTGAIKNKIVISDQAISANLVLAKNEYIIAGTLSGVCASVHAATNSIVWCSTLDSPVFASPALYDGDKYAVFAEVSGDIHCRTVEKGIKIWKYQGAKGNIFSSFYIKQVEKLKWQIVFGCFDNKVYSISLKSFVPSLHWKTQLNSPMYCTPCGLSDKFILAASNNGTLYIIETDTGAIVVEHRLPDETFSSPAAYGDYIFIGCRDDNLYSLKCTWNE